MLEPGPLFARDGDKNRSEQISYRILRGQNRLGGAGGWVGWGGSAVTLHATFSPSPTLRERGQYLPD